MKIKRNMKMKESREFWASIDDICLPPLGESWWKTEKEMSVSLLDAVDPATLKLKEYK